MAIFVTGGTGYIGSYVLHGLLEKCDEPLFVLARKGSGAKLWRALQLHQDLADLCDDERGRDRRSGLAKDHRVMNSTGYTSTGRPFIYANDFSFEADRILLLDAALPADEREDFGYDDSSIDWPHYWIDVHIPALRKWSYPLIEGRPVEV